MTVKAILFDFDYTLGDRDAYAYDCYKMILEKYSGISDPLMFESVLQNCMVWDQQGDVNKAYLKTKLKEDYGIFLPIEDFNTYWDSVLWQYCRPYDDAELTLKELSGKYKLGLVTNGPSDGQRKKLEQSGLSSYFSDDAVTVSGDYPFKKPDPRLFLEACRKLDVKPEEAVYVGDLFYRDVLGAAQAGLTPVWMWDKGIRKCDYNCLIIHKISDLLEHF